MPQNKLFEKIRAVRNELRQHEQFGPLVAERYLISGGDLIGHWFCFENADVKWSFDSGEVEVWLDGKMEGEFLLETLKQVNETLDQPQPAPIAKAA